MISQIKEVLGWTRVDNPEADTRLRRKAAALAPELGCGIRLAMDLLTLAGGDEHIVRYASGQTNQGVESLKAIIIDERLSMIEKKLGA